MAANDVVDGCAGRPAEGGQRKSVTVKAEQAAPAQRHTRVTEAFPWNEEPHQVFRDRDRIDDAVVKSRLGAMGPVASTSMPVLTFTTFALN